VHDLATVQQLPPALLEQLLLRLRRAGLLEARRGRLGGYRLARAATAIPLAAVLAAVGGGPMTRGPGGDGGLATGDETAGDRVAALLERRLVAALERELAHCSLAELLFDLRSTRAGMEEEGGLLLG
jgi:Rrf2 family protein